MSTPAPPPGPPTPPGSRGPRPAAHPGDLPAAAVPPPRTPIPTEPPAAARSRSPWRVVALVLLAVLVVGVGLALLSRALRQTRVESAVYQQPVSRLVVDTSTG